MRQVAQEKVMTERPRLGLGLAACCLLGLLWSPPSADAVTASDATGTLSLLTTHKTVTAGDAGSWMRPGWDWVSRPTVPPADRTARPDEPVAFQVESWSTGTAIHLRLFIPDQTTRQVWSTTSTLRKGDRVIIVIDPNMSRSANLENGLTSQTKDHMYVVTLKDELIQSVRHFLPEPVPGSTSSTLWKGSPEASTAASAGPAVPGTSLYNSNQYQVEVQIPFSELSNAGTISGDVGIAFAVINDLGAPLNASTDQLTGSAFPLTMPIGNADSPMREPQVTGVPPDAGVWAQPNRWGIGYFNSDPTSMNIGMVHLPHSLADWHAEAIRLGVCNIASWDDVPQITTGSQNVAGWYRYYPAGPCQMGVWVNAKNTRMTGLPIEGRLLILWGDSFVGMPFQWHVVRLTNSIAFPANLDTITREIWESVPSGGSFGAGTTHPCLKVYVLPADLDSSSTPMAINATWMNANVTPNAVLTVSQVNQIEAAYGVNGYPGTLRAAQMNFTNLASASATCPSTEQCTFREVIGLRSTGIGEARALLVANPTAARPPVKVVEESSKDPFVRVDIAGFGIAASTQARNYVFLEPLGGFGWIAPRSQFQDSKPVKFALGNPAVLWRDFSGQTPRDIPSPPREIVLGVRTTTSVSDPPNIKLPNHKGKVFEPGETILTQVEVERPGDGLCERILGCGPCRKVTLVSGGGWVLPGTVVLIGGLACVGGFAFRRRKPRKHDGGQLS